MTSKQDERVLDSTNEDDDITSLFLPKDPQSGSRRSNTFSVGKVTVAVVACVCTVPCAWSSRFYARGSVESTFLDINLNHIPYFFVDQKQAILTPHSFFSNHI